MAEYQLLGRLGAGGMGTVYLGRDRAGELVAVKLLHGHLAADPQFVARLGAEAAAARRVASFCTARVLDAQVGGSQPFLVTEYVEGPTLDAVLAERGPLPASQVEALAVGVAAALTAIHAAGVVHRDLKPTNVMLSPFGPKVIDFGVAKAPLNTQLTQTGLVFGTPGWMAPEQIFGQMTSAGDVYVWGLLVARAGTGWRPSPDLRPMPPTTTQLATLPPGLSAAVAAALQLDPARRPGARELLLQLCGSTKPTMVRTATSVLSQPWDPSYPVHPGQQPAAAQPPPAAPQPPPGTPRPHPAVFPPQPRFRRLTWQRRHPTRLHHPAPVHHSPQPHRPAQLALPQRPPQRARVALPPPPHARPAPPQPYRRRKRWYRRKRLWLLLVIAALILLNSAGEDPAAQLPQGTARDGILEFAVTSMDCASTPLGPPGLARQPQGQLCQLRMRVHNFGEQSRRVHVGSQKLYDRAGRQFSADGGAWAYLPESVPFFQQEINPGNEVSATLVFDVPADAKPARLVVHDSPLSGGATITL